MSRYLRFIKLETTSILTFVACLCGCMTPNISYEQHLMTLIEPKLHIYNEGLDIAWFDDEERIIPYITSPEVIAYHAKADITATLPFALLAGLDVSDVHPQASYHRHNMNELSTLLLYHKDRFDNDAHLSITIIQDSLTVKKYAGVVAGYFDWQFYDVMSGTCHFIASEDEILYLGIPRKKARLFFDCIHIVSPVGGLFASVRWMMPSYFSILHIDSEVDLQGESYAIGRPLSRSPLKGSVGEGFLPDRNVLLARWDDRRSMDTSLTHLPEAWSLVDSIRLLIPNNSSIFQVVRMANEGSQWSEIQDKLMENITFSGESGGSINAMVLPIIFARQGQTAQIENSHSPDAEEQDQSR